MANDPESDDEEMGRTNEEDIEASVEDEEFEEIEDDDETEEDEEGTEA